MKMKKSRENCRKFIFWLASGKHLLENVVRILTKMKKPNNPY